MKNWVKELQSEGPKDIILAVVGNKTDKVDNEEVPYETAKNFAKSVNALFKLTSAKEGKGINVRVCLRRNFSRVSPSASMRTASLIQAQNLRVVPTAPASIKSQTRARRKVDAAVVTDISRHYLSIRIRRISASAATFPGTADIRHWNLRLST